MEEKAKSIFSLSKHLTIASIASFTLASFALPSWAADGLIRAIQYDATSKHFTIDATGSVKAVANSVNVGNGKRVVVDIDNAEIGLDLPHDAQLLRDLSRKMPELKNITVNQYGGNGRPVVRILLDIENQAENVRLVRSQGSRLELEIAKQAPVVSPTQSLPRTDAYQPTSARTSEVVSRESYYQTLKMLDDQKRQIQALQEQVSRLHAEQNQPSSTKIQPVSSSDTLLQSQKNTISNLQNQLADVKRKLDLLTREKMQWENNASASDSPTLDEMKRTLVTMNQRYDQISSENRTLKSQLLVAQSQSKLATSDSALTTKQAEIDRLKLDLQTARKQLQQVQASTQSNNPALDEMQRTLVSMNQRYDQLVQENQRLRLEKNQLESKSQPAVPAVSATTLQGLRSQLTTAQQSLNDAIRTINEQNKEIAYLRNQVTDVKAGMDVTTQTQLNNLRAERDVQESKIRTLEQQLALKSSSPQSTGTTTEVMTLKRQLNQLTMQYKTSLDDLNQQLQSKNQQLLERERQQTESRDVTQQRAAQLQTQVTSLQTQLAEAERKASRAQATVSQLQNTQIAPEQIQQRDSQIANLQREVTRLKTLESNTGSNNSATQTLRSELSKLSQENQHLKSQITELNTLKAARQNNKTPQTNAETLKAEIATLTQQNQTLKAQLDAKSKAAAPVDSQILKNEIARLTTENQELKAKQASAVNTDADAQSRVNDLQSELNSIKSQYQKALGDAKQARQELESQKKVMMATKPTANTSGTALQKQMADLNQQLTTLRKENSALKERFAAAKSSQPASSNAEAEKNYQAAKAALVNGSVEQALEQFKTAQLLEPDNSRYTVDYGIALAQEHDYAEAADLLRKYLTRNPGDREAYGQLGKIYLLNDQTDMATQALTRAIPIGTLNNYATALKKLGKTDEAESIFKMALKMDPNDSEVLFNLGNLYNATERLELARNSYLQAIQAKPDFAEAHYNLGLIYSKLGDRAKAVTHLEKFLNLSPNAKNADTIRAYVEKLKV